MASSQAIGPLDRQDGVEWLQQRGTSSYLAAGVFFGSLPEDAIS
jgi:hypothetical protein